MAKTKLKSKFFCHCKIDYFSEYHVLSSGRQSDYLLSQDKAQDFVLTGILSFSLNSRFSVLKLFYYYLLSQDKAQDFVLTGILSSLTTILTIYCPNIIFLLPPIPGQGSGFCPYNHFVLLCQKLHKLSFLTHFQLGLQHI